MPARRRNRARCTLDTGARALAVGFALVLSLPAFGSRFADDELRSRWENRPLADPPRLGTAGSTGFFRAMDRYLDDHFGFALELNQLYRRVQYHVFRDSPAPNVTLGLDGFVFLTSHEAEGRLDVLTSLCIENTEPEVIERAIESWGAVFAGFEGRTGRVVLLIAPTKPVVYPDKLPRSVPSRLREACAQYRARVSAASALATWGREEGRLVLYPEDLFHERRFRGNFYPKENYHFTGASAHAFARTAFAALGVDPGAAYDESTVVETETWDLRQFFGFTRRERVERFAYAPFGLRSRQAEPRFVKEYYARATDFGTIAVEAPLTDRTALVICNSFGRLAAPHLAPAFRSLTWVNVNHLAPGETEAFLEDFVDRMKPDDLIFLFDDASVSRRAIALAAALERHPPASPR